MQYFPDNDEIMFLIWSQRRGFVTKWAFTLKMMELAAHIMCYNLSQFITLCHNLLHFVTICYTLSQFVTIWAPSWNLKDSSTLSFQFDNSTLTVYIIHPSQIDHINEIEIMIKGGYCNFLLFHGSVGQYVVGKHMKWERSSSWVIDCPEKCFPNLLSWKAKRWDVRWQTRGELRRDLAPGLNGWIDNSEASQPLCGNLQIISRLEILDDITGISTVEIEPNSVDLHPFVSFLLQIFPKTIKLAFRAAESKLWLTLTM